MEIMTAVKDAMVKGKFTKLFRLLRTHIAPLNKQLEDARRPQEQGGELLEGEDKYFIVVEPQPNGEVLLLFLTIGREGENEYKVKRLGKLGALENILIKAKQANDAD